MEQQFTAAEREALIAERDALLAKVAKLERELYVLNSSPEVGGMPIRLRPALKTILEILAQKDIISPAEFFELYPLIDAKIDQYDATVRDAGDGGQPISGSCVS